MTLWAVEEGISRDQKRKKRQLRRPIEKRWPSHTITSPKQKYALDDSLLYCKEPIHLDGISRSLDKVFFGKKPRTSTRSRAGGGKYYLLILSASSYLLIVNKLAEHTALSVQVVHFFCCLNAKYNLDYPELVKLDFIKYISRRMFTKYSSPVKVSHFLTRYSLWSLTFVAASSSLSFFPMIDTNLVFPDFFVEK